MRLVFVGTGEFGVPTLRALTTRGHQVLRCVSQPDRPAGRGRQVQSTHIHALADELGLPHVETADINALDAAELLNGAEIVVVVAFGQKIGPGLLRAAAGGWYNLHASLLPRHRGAAPYQWAILAGDRETGVTMFKLDEKWDAGPIVGVRATPIGELETADELHDRLSHVAAELAVETLEAIATGRVEPRYQDAASATRAPKLSKQDGVLDWSRGARELQRRIHGLWSWPGAMSELHATPEGEPGATPAIHLQFARAELVDEVTPPKGERIAGALMADGVVQCGAGRLRLLEVKPAGGRLMKFDEFARGRRLPPVSYLRTPEAAK